jgi:hypothetical protein
MWQYMAPVIYYTLNLPPLTSLIVNSLYPLNRYYLSQYVDLIVVCYLGLNTAPTDQPKTGPGAASQDQVFGTIRAESTRLVNALRPIPMRHRRSIWTQQRAQPRPSRGRTLEFESLRLFCSRVLHKLPCGDLAHRQRFLTCIITPLD